MEDPTPAVLLTAFGAVLLFLLIVFGRKSLPHGVLQSIRTGMSRQRASFDEKLVTARAGVWSSVALRLGAELLVGRDGHRIRFKWQGRDAFIYEGDPVRFEVSGTDFGPLRARLLLGSTAGRRLGGLPESITLSEGDEADVLSFATVSVVHLLRDLLAAGAGEVRIHDGLRITARIRRDAESVVRFSLLCLQLAHHARIFASQAAGIVFVETRSSTTGQCQICGAELDGQLVRCARCSTLHHRDCWQYTGACSTYGCGERTFVA